MAGGYKASSARVIFCDISEASQKIASSGLSERLTPPATLTPKGNCFARGQGGEGQTLAVLSSIFVVLRLYHENLRAEFAQPFATLPYHVRTKCQRAADPRSRFAR